MQYTKQEIIKCLVSRREWYTKALAMVTGEQEWDRTYDFPDDPQNTLNWGIWRGCIRELTNTIDMLSHHSITN